MSNKAFTACFVVMLLFYGFAESYNSDDFSTFLSDLGSVYGGVFENLFKNLSTLYHNYMEQFSK